MPIIEEIALSCKKLRLSRNIIENLEVIEAKDNKEFLLELFNMEIEYREKSRMVRNIKNAGFYSHKSFSDYVFDDIKLPEGLTVDNLKSCDFIRNKQNLIMYGNVGTGKTHLATAIGIAACNHGLTVGFFRTAALVNRLADAKKGGNIQKLLKKLSKYELIICDEWGYVPLDREGSQLLFQVISDCYEQRSLIITTNLEFSKWVNIFYDKQMTTAMIDRLVHYSHLLIFDGDSWRVRNSLIRQ